MLTIKDYRNLFHRLYPTLCLFADKYLNNLDASKDIVQEVFIKLWEDQKSFKHENQIKSYLYTCTRNKALDLLKSKRYRETIYFDDKEIHELESDPFFLREVVVSETSIILEKAINTLPFKCAQIVRLSIKNLTNPEIAEELGVSINTVKAQKRIAYKRLRPLLKDAVELASLLLISLN